VKRSVWTLIAGWLIGAALANPAPANAADVVRFYHLDSLGSVRAITDADGAVVQRNDYFPFGEEIGCRFGRTEAYCDSQGPGRRFTGKLRDEDTGLDYVFARYYSSAQGRFTTTDPDNAGALVSVPQTWNGYSYGRNNPLAYVDPSGYSDAAAQALNWSPVWAPAMAPWLVGTGEVIGTVAPPVGITAGALVIAYNYPPTYELIGEYRDPEVEMAGFIANTQLELFQQWFNGKAKTAQANQPQPTPTAAPAAPAPSTTSNANTKAAGSTAGNLPKPGKGKGSVPPEERDPKRRFDEKSREKKREEQGGKCAQCGKPIDETNSNGHHVERHADKGQTVPENHAELCIPCHKDIHR